MTSETSPLSKGRAGSRRGFLLSAASAATASLAGCAGGGNKAPMVVSTSSGGFRGQTTEGIPSYLGIPYAQPPVGALRFRAPQPFVPRGDVVAANSFGAASIQTV